MISHISIVSCSIRLKIAVEGWRCFNESMTFLDLYEKINSWEFSLKTICAVNVVHRILASVEAKKDEKLSKTGAEEAVRIVEKLDLPIRLKELLAGLVKPIYRELEIWHIRYRFEVSPVWSPRGTIDWLGSTRAVVDDQSLRKCYRFLIACWFCHERQIFELARLLTDHEKAEVLNLPQLNYMSKYRPMNYDEELLGIRYAGKWQSLVKFWMNVIRGGVVRLPQESWEKGLYVAAKTRNGAAFAYFLGKVDTEAMRRVLNERIDLEGLLLYPKMPPATYCLLLSKLDYADLGRSVLEEFAIALLKGLIKWPYQPLFLDAASSLSVNFSKWTITDLLLRIVVCAEFGWKDFDYRGLFIGFFEMIVSLNPALSMDVLVDTRIVMSLLLDEDELLAKFAFGKLSDRAKELLLLEGHSRICASLALNRKSHLLEPFVRLFSANRIDLLLKVKGRLWISMDTRSFTNGMLQRKRHSASVVEAGRRLVSQIVDKIIEEQKASSGKATTAKVVGQA